jgi:hypothetical protein
MRRALLAWLATLMLTAVPVWAGERLSVCFNYGCLSQADAEFSEAQLADVGRLLASAETAAQERQALAVAVGRLLGWAGEQTPVGADRGGNFFDAGIYGKMDCIDHAKTTTRLLEMIERRGLMHYHRVLAPVLRRRFLIFEHNAAQIEQTGGGDPADDGSGARYVVDSWFFDNGQPAVVMPLALWQSGESPNGAE